MARSYLQAQKCLGGIKRSDSHQYYDSGFRTKIPFSSPSIISASPSSFTKQISTSSHSSTHPKTSQSRNYQENNFSSTPFLFSSIYCPQKRQFPSSYNRPISSKQIFDHSNLQDGVSCKDYSDHHRTSMGLNLSRQVPGVILNGGIIYTSLNNNHSEGLDVSGTYTLCKSNTYAR